MYHQDWLMRQIQVAVEAIARIMFNKQNVNYEIIDKKKYTETDILHDQLMELLAASDLNSAENMLFENINTDDLNYLLVALDFYSRINELDDDHLEKYNFSREEIKNGLEEVKSMFGIDF